MRWNDLIRPTTESKKKRIHNGNRSCGCAESEAFQAILEDRIRKVSVRQKVEIWVAGQKEQSIAQVAKAFAIDRYTAGEIIRRVEGAVAQLWEENRLVFYFYELFKPIFDEGKFPRFPGEFSRAELSLSEPSEQEREDGVEIIRGMVLAATNLLRKIQLFRGVGELRIRRLSEAADWFKAARRYTLNRRKEIQRKAIRRAIAERAQRDTLENTT